MSDVSIEKVILGDPIERKRLYEIDLYVENFDEELTSAYKSKSIEELSVVLDRLNKEYKLTRQYKKNTKEILDIIKLVEMIQERKLIMLGDGTKGIILK